MKAQELKQLGFRKKSLGTDYWYELNFRNHKFITNDTIRNRGQDKWFVGYQDTKHEDIFWFNGRLESKQDFSIIAFVLIGKSLTEITRIKKDLAVSYKSEYLKRSKNI